MTSNAHAELQRGIDAAVGILGDLAAPMGQRIDAAYQVLAALRAPEGETDAVQAEPQRRPDSIAEPTFLGIVESIFAAVIIASILGLFMEFCR